MASETLLRKDQSVDVTPVSQLTVQPPCTASITDDQPDVEILPGVEHQVQMGECTFGPVKIRSC